jgi:hypothetical protein
MTIFGVTINGESLFTAGFITLAIMCLFHAGFIRNQRGDSDE